MQSNLPAKLQSGKLHVGIIMDGNGRWATRRGLSRVRGHEAGVEAIRRIVEAAPEQGVGTLTLYAFSTDNWRRPKAEVAALMTLLRFYLANEVESLVRNGVRLTVIGRRDRLPDGIAAAIGRAEKATASGDVLHLRIAVDYSARDCILRAAGALEGPPSTERFTLLLGEAMHASAGAPDVDPLCGQRLLEGAAVRLRGDHHHRLVVDEAGAQVAGNRLAEEGLVLVELDGMLGGRGGLAQRGVRCMAGIDDRRVVLRIDHVASFLR